MELLENLKKRYATKKFDASQKVSEQNIDYIKEAIQLSASSFGLQPYKVLEVKSPGIREALKPMSWGQSQITDASNLFVFCNYIDVKDQDTDDLIQLKSETTGIEISKLSGYGDFIKGKIEEKSAEEVINWTAKQTYIALANAMSACAELNIDSTPMEGFDSAAYNKTLGLSEKGLNASVVLAIGYRSSEDASQHIKKVRKSVDSIFEEV